MNNIGDQIKVKYRKGLFTIIALTSDNKEYICLVNDTKLYQIGWPITENDIKVDGLDLKYLNMIASYVRIDEVEIEVDIVQDHFVIL